jgi:hypothetical protein
MGSGYAVSELIDTAPSIANKGVDIYSGPQGSLAGSLPTWLAWFQQNLEYSVGSIVYSSYDTSTSSYNDLSVAQDVTQLSIQDGGDLSGGSLISSSALATYSSLPYFTYNQSTLFVLIHGTGKITDSQFLDQASRRSAGWYSFDELLDANIWGGQWDTGFGETPAEIDGTGQATIAAGQIFLNLTDIFANADSTNNFIYCNSVLTPPGPKPSSWPTDLNDHYKQVALLPTDKVTVGGNVVRTPFQNRGNTIISGDYPPFVVPDAPAGTPGNQDNIFKQRMSNVYVPSFDPRYGEARSSLNAWLGAQYNYAKPSTVDSSIEHWELSVNYSVGSAVRQKAVSSEEDEDINRTTKDVLWLCVKSHESSAGNAPPYYDDSGSANWNEEHWRPYSTIMNRPNSSISDLWQGYKSAEAIGKLNIEVHPEGKFAGGNTEEPRVRMSDMIGGSRMYGHITICPGKEPDKKYYRKRNAFGRRRSIEFNHPPSNSQNAAKVDLWLFPNNFRKDHGGSINYAVHFADNSKYYVRRARRRSFWSRFALGFWGRKYHVYYDGQFNRSTFKTLAGAADYKLGQRQVDSSVWFGQTNPLEDSPNHVADIDSENDILRFSFDQLVPDHYESHHGNTISVDGHYAFIIQDLNAGTICRPEFTYRDVSNTPSRSEQDSFNYSFSGSEYGKYSPAKWTAYTQAANEIVNFTNNATTTDSNLKLLATRNYFNYLLLGPSLGSENPLKPLTVWSMDISEDQFEHVCGLVQTGFRKINLNDLSSGTWDGLPAFDDTVLGSGSSNVALNYDEYVNNNNDLLSRYNNTDDHGKWDYQDGNGPVFADTKLKAEFGKSHWLLAGEDQGAHIPPAPPEEQFTIGSDVNSMPKSFIDQMKTNASPYNESTDYAGGSVVTSSDKYWFAKKRTSGNVPVEGEYWKELVGKNTSVLKSESLSPVLSLAESWRRIIDSPNTSEPQDGGRDSPFHALNRKLDFSFIWKEGIHSSCLPYFFLGFGQYAPDFDPLQIGSYRKGMLTEVWDFRQEVQNEIISTISDPALQAAALAAIRPRYMLFRLKQEIDMNDLDGAFPGLKVENGWEFVTTSSTDHDGTYFSTENVPTAASSEWLDISTYSPNEKVHIKYPSQPGSLGGVSADFYIVYNCTAANNNAPMNQDATWSADATLISKAIPVDTSHWECLSDFQGANPGSASGKGNFYEAIQTYYKGDFKVYGYTVKDFNNDTRFLIESNVVRSPTVESNLLLDTGVVTSKSIFGKIPKAMTTYQSEGGTWPNGNTLTPTQWGLTTHSNLIIEEFLSTSKTSGGALWGEWVTSSDIADKITLTPGNELGLPSLTPSVQIGFPSSAASSPTFDDSEFLNSDALSTQKDDIVRHRGGPIPFYVKAHEDVGLYIASILKSEHKHKGSANADAKLKQDISGLGNEFSSLNNLSGTSLKDSAISGALNSWKEKDDIDPGVSVLVAGPECLSEKINQLENNEYTKIGHIIYPEVHDVAYRKELSFLSVRTGSPGEAAVSSFINGGLTASVPPQSSGANFNYNWGGLVTEIGNLESLYDGESNQFNPNSLAEDPADGNHYDSNGLGLWLEIVDTISSNIATNLGSSSLSPTLQDVSVGGAMVTVVSQPLFDCPNYSITNGVPEFSFSENASLTDDLSDLMGAIIPAAELSLQSRVAVLVDKGAVLSKLINGNSNSPLSTVSFGLSTGDLLLLNMSSFQELEGKELSICLFDGISDDLDAGNFEGYIDYWPDLLAHYEGGQNWDYGDGNEPANNKTKAEFGKSHWVTFGNTGGFGTNSPEYRYCPGMPGIKEITGTIKLSPPPRADFGSCPNYIEELNLFVFHYQDDEATKRAFREINDQTPHSEPTHVKNGEWWGLNGYDSPHALDNWFYRLNHFGGSVMNKVMDYIEVDFVFPTDSGLFGDDGPSVRITSEAEFRRNAGVNPRSPQHMTYKRSIIESLETLRIYPPFAFTGSSQGLTGNQTDANGNSMSDLTGGANFAFESQAWFQLKVSDNLLSSTTNHKAFLIMNSWQHPLGVPAFEFVAEYRKADGSLNGNRKLQGSNCRFAPESNGNTAGTASGFYVYNSIPGDLDFKYLSPRFNIPSVLLENSEQFDAGDRFNHNTGYAHDPNFEAELSSKLGGLGFSKIGEYFKSKIEFSSNGTSSLTFEGFDPSRGDLLHNNQSGDPTIFQYEIDRDWFPSNGTEPEWTVSDGTGVPVGAPVLKDYDWRSGAVIEIDPPTVSSLSCEFIAPLEWTELGLDTDAGNKIDNEGWVYDPAQNPKVALDAALTPETISRLASGFDSTDRIQYLRSFPFTHFKVAGGTSDKIKNYSIPELVELLFKPSYTRVDPQYESWMVKPGSKGWGFIENIKGGDDDHDSVIDWTWMFWRNVRSSFSDGTFPAGHDSTWTDLHSAWEATGSKLWDRDTSYSPGDIVKRSNGGEDAEWLHVCQLLPGSFDPYHAWKVYWMEKHDSSGNRIGGYKVLSDDNSDEYQRLLTHALFAPAEGSNKGWYGLGNGFWEDVQGVLQDSDIADSSVSFSYSSDYDNFGWVIGTEGSCSIAGHNNATDCVAAPHNGVWTSTLTVGHEPWELRLELKGGAGYKKYSSVNIPYPAGTNDFKGSDRESISKSGSISFSIPYSEWKQFAHYDDFEIRVSICDKIHSDRDVHDLFVWKGIKPYTITNGAPEEDGGSYLADDFKDYNSW